MSDQWELGLMDECLALSVSEYVSVMHFIRLLRRLHSIHWLLTATVNLIMQHCTGPLSLSVYSLCPLFLPAGITILHIALILGSTFGETQVSINNNW